MESSNLNLVVILFFKQDTINHKPYKMGFDFDTYNT